MKELKEQVHKEFDEILSNKTLGEQIYTDFGYGCMECGGGLKEEWVKSFIDSLIDKTVQMTEERIVAGLNLIELSGKPEGFELAIDDIISLITNKSGINK